MFTFNLNEVMYAEKQIRLVTVEIYEDFTSNQKVIFNNK